MFKLTCHAQNVITVVSIATIRILYAHHYRQHEQTFGQARVNQGK